MLSLNYLLVGFRRLCQLLYRNPCFLWFQCWLETRNSVWICLNLVPKLDPKLVPKKDSKRGQKWVFQFWPPFWSQFWAQFGFQFWSQFWPQFWVRFWSQFWAHFGSKSNSFCGFWLRCRSGASKETRSGAKMVPEAMRNHFAGTKVLRNTLQVSNQARESYIERSLTRIFPKCLLEVKAEKDFNICILDFWNCIFQDFSPILLKHLVLKPLWRQNLDPGFGNRNLGRNVGWRSNAQRGAFS